MDVGGATLATAEMRAGLIDEYAIVTHPERLHDGPLQVLLAARMSLDVVTDQLHGLRSNADESIAELRSLKSDLRTAANDIRATLSGLHPQVLGQLGLVAGLRELTGEAERRTGAHVELGPDAGGGPTFM